MEGNVMFDIYARISDEGDRSPEEVAEQLAIYEADCRQWAERNGVEVGLVVTETDVSGSTPVDERALGGLINRVEANDSAGILTPYLDRFGRDTIEGCLAYRRIVVAGGRLVCCNDGLDSARDGNKTMFTIRMAMAEDYLDRVRANFQARIKAAAEKGAYLACKPPVGYVRDHETGRITPHPKLAPLIEEAFRRRAEGEACRSIAAWLVQTGGGIEVPNPKRPKNRKPGDPETVRPLATITENGVRHLIASRAYLGEATVQSGKRGQPDVIKDAHAPMVTPDLWERAQAAGGPYRPNTGRLAAQVRLGGLVYCGGCGKKLKVGGSNGGEHASYLCTRENCPGRAAIQAARLDAFIEGALQDAVYAREPHVAAVLEGDDRYERAMAAVEEARVEKEMWRDQVKVSDVGIDAWRAGLATRQAAEDLARKALREVPAPRTAYKGRHPATGIRGKVARLHAVEAAMNREANARLLARVVVKPVGRGRRVDPAERVEIWFVGADAPYEIPAATEAVTDLAAVA
jgi:DNA invertase Pin-like site-specific DNA recombinase